MAAPGGTPADRRLHLAAGLTAILLSLFAGIAAVLAMVGLYGLSTYALAQRTREMAIRLALGANPGHDVRQVLREDLLLAGLGTAAGLGAAVGVAQPLRGLLHGVAPLDPASFVALPTSA